MEIDNAGETFRFSANEDVMNIFNSITKKSIKKIDSSLFKNNIRIIQESRNSENENTYQNKEYQNIRENFNSTINENSFLMDTSQIEEINEEKSIKENKEESNKNKIEKGEIIKNYKNTNFSNINEVIPSIENNFEEDELEEYNFNAKIKKIEINKKGGIKDKKSNNNVNNALKMDIIEKEMFKHKNDHLNNFKEINNSIYKEKYRNNLIQIDNYRKKIYLLEKKWEDEKYHFLFKQKNMIINEIEQKRKGKYLEKIIYFQDILNKKNILLNKLRNQENEEISSIYFNENEIREKIEKSKKENELLKKENYILKKKFDELNKKKIILSFE